MSEITRILDIGAGLIMLGTIYALVFSFGIPQHNQGRPNWAWPFVGAGGLVYYAMRKQYQIGRLNQELKTKDAAITKQE